MTAAVMQTAANEQFLRRELVRLRAARDYPTAGALAQYLDPSIQQTPALQMIDEHLEWAFSTPAARLMISMPSQTGKSQRVAIAGTLRAMMLHPDWRCVIATHAEHLALKHSTEIRGLIQTFGSSAAAETGEPLPDRLGLAIPRRASAAKFWRLRGHKGSLTAAGIDTKLPGVPADYLLLDDLYASMEDADSAAIRRRVNSWLDSVALQRLGGDAPIVAISTRWNEFDALAYLQQLMPDEWRVLNFPAIAEDGVLDSLGREPGVLLESPRNQDWIKRREQSPARVWSAMYQGNPKPREGGLFEQAWFDDHRVMGDAPATTLRVVAIDPAETGKSDEAGVVAGGLTADGKVVLTHDWSKHMTSAEWAERGVELALATHAHELAVEGYSAATTYRRTVVEAWKKIRDERYPGQAMPFRIRMWRGKSNADALARSVGMRNAVELGKCVVLGHGLEKLESKAVGWHVGQHQPDAVAAAVIVYDRLVTLTSSTAQLASPVRRQPGSGGAGGRWTRTL
ncbi:terminase large subunit domain-containing protein [Nocardia sp. CA-290969]|uniref:terminase large subunit domain-containing protein n=1 Tax=Nocardia sp. CA-290969 TaxID=3239986 RepID=UPI003D8FEB26